MNKWLYYYLNRESCNLMYAVRQAQVKQIGKIKAYTYRHTSQNISTYFDVIVTKMSNFHLWNGAALVYAVS